MSKRPTKARPPSRPRRTSRLPPHVRPEAAALHLHLDPLARGFGGEITYTLSLERPCRLIELHAADLTISSVRIENGDFSARGRVELHPECETVVLRFDRLLRAGHTRLSLRFRGRVRDDLRGLYRGTDPTQPWLATQLCPTDARRVFPTFDEPGIKARYTIEVTAPSDQTVLSNAPVQKRSRPSEGHRTTTFATTPPLSAYLVAVAVGPFRASRPRVAGKTPIRVYTLPGRQTLGRFALRAAVESLDRLEKWFGLAHPYPKLDLLALPDFAFGAMENAGAVFFRDSVLLLDEKEASVEDRTRAAETIAHELAHMWFGNLVTMAWWNDLWLNESFATWMAYVIVDDWEPSFRIWHEFIARRENALELDALASSHPIAPPVRTADEAQENFDAITYAKGASVLRMLERYVGARPFRDGVRRYIRQHKEGIATASDLWRALEETTSLPIERIVSPWTTRTGFPLVRVERGRGGRNHLAQERFLLLPGRAPDRSPTWATPWIGRPLAQKGPRRLARTLLTRRREPLSLPGTESGALYANAEEAGFFRVDHGQAAWPDLIQALPRLAPVERIGLVGHQWALVRAGRAGLSDLLDLLAAANEEEDPDVLLAVERVLTELLQQLARDAGQDTTERLRAWIVRHFEPALDALPNSPSVSGDPLRRRRRARLLWIVGALGRSKKWVESCRVLAARHLSSGTPLPIDGADLILRIAAHSGDARLHSPLLEVARKATTPQTRRRALFALAGFEDPPLLKRSLRACLDATLAPAVDRASLFMLLLGSPGQAEATWDHLRRVWPRLEREMPPILLARLAAETATALPVSQAEEIASFFAAHPLVAGDRVLRQVAERIRLARRLQRYAEGELVAYLLEADPDPPLK